MSFPRFQFEELTCFKLDENPATVLKKSKFQNTVRILVGTQTGKVVVYTPSNLQTLMISVFERPVLNIFVDEGGASTFFMVTDGRQWKAIDYVTLAFVDIEIPNGTFGVGWGRDQYLICQVDGISLKPTESQFASIFKKREEPTYVYKGKIELYSQFCKDFCWFLDTDDNLRAVSTITHQLVRFKISNEGLAHPADYIPRPCKCGCFPNIIALGGAVLVSWHNAILVYSAFGGDCTSGLLGRLVAYRQLQSAEEHELLPVSCILLKDRLVNSAVIFDNYIYAMVEGESQALEIYNIAGQLLQEMTLDGQLIAMDLIFAHRVFSYIPNSEHRPENFELIILEESKVIFAEFEVELDSIMADVNEVYSLCEEYKERPFDKQNFSQFVRELTKRLITYADQNELPEFLDVPDNFISLFLKMFLIEDAHYVLSELIAYTNDKERYLNTYLSEFANAGVLSMLLPFVPNPGSAKPVSNEIYQQILQSLLLNDYKSFYDILDAYQPVYDIDQLAVSIKNSLLIANQAFDDEKMDPLWLKRALIYLYTKQSRFDLAFEHILDVHDVKYCVKFCIENDLYKELLSNFRRFKTDEIVAIIYEVILKNSKSQNIFLQSLHTILGVEQQYGSAQKLLQSYLRQTYGSDQLNLLCGGASVTTVAKAANDEEYGDFEHNNMELDNKTQEAEGVQGDENLRNLTELLSLLYQNILLIEESQQIRELLFEMRHFYALLQEIYKQSNPALVFYEITLLCCVSAHRDSQGCEYLDIITAFISALICDVQPQFKGLALMIQKYKVHKEYSQLFVDLSNFEVSEESELLTVLFAVLSIRNDKDLERACQLVNESKSSIFAPVFVLNAAFSLKYPISPEILRSALAPLLSDSSKNISPSLQALAAPMRQILPLDDLLMTSAGLDILYETQQEALFAKSCLEVVGADYFIQYLKRERAAKRGVVPVGSCVFCGELDPTEPFFVMFCGHIAHECCSMKLLKQKNWQGMQVCICIECNKEERIAQALKTGDKWFDIIE